MDKSIIRMFHPIGQGAFYSERHENFNIVYDCGNWRNTKLADKVVENSFNANTIIDILFISHFDFDHVSKVGTLKNTFKIKRVVLPLLHENEKIFLVNVYNNLGLNIVASLVNDPITFFGGETEIIFVTESESSDNNNSETFIDTLNPQSTYRNAQTIKSGTILRNGEWIFIPYNFRYSERYKELEKLFSKKGLDIEKFRTDLGYSISNRQSIKEIFDGVSGGINQNSMLLYSGLENTKDEDKIITESYFRNNTVGFNHERNIGCIYTGDADLNITDIKKIFNRYWNLVGMIQIPHHGSIKSFNKNNFLKGNFFCPISFGVNNSYGHPSNQLLIDLMTLGNYPIQITEALDSAFIQVILYEI